MVTGSVLLVATEAFEAADMGQEFQEIDARIKSWIERQHLFFVSTAPLSGDGLINCSPKGLDGLRVTGPRQLVYADVGGSGIESLAHVKENGRIVIMLCSFEGPPKIYRFYGTGRAVESHDAEFSELRELFPNLPTIRDFIVIDVTCIRDACGFGVPVYAYQSERDALQKWSDAKTPDELIKYRQEKNAQSLDGLQGLEIPDPPKSK